MITDKDCAHFCYEIYHPSPDTSLWAHLDLGDDDGVCWSLIHTDDADVIVLRGSKTFTDWFRDLVALANPFVHHQLGPVHPGFFLGLEHAWDDIKPLLKNKPLVTGHSLGAGRAAILCGMMLAEGVTPVRRVCFGEPKPGFRPLADLIRTVPAASYRNGDARHHDLVTDVPFSFPPEEYVHPTSLTLVSATPQVEHWSDFGVFAWHHMQLYEQALQNGPTSSA